MLLGLARTFVVLLAIKVWKRAGPPKAHLFTSPLAAIGLLLIGRGAGLSRQELGLGDVRARGLWPAVGAAGVVAAAYVAGLWIPAARRAYLAPRSRRSWGAALYTALVAVPLSTVVFEEVAFRGVLFGLLDHSSGPVWATAVTAALFGLWHVDQHHGWATLGVVVFTGLAGVLFAVLRVSGGNLLAPFVLHWAVNGFGVLIACWAWKRS